MSEREQLIQDLGRIRENQYQLSEGESLSKYTELMLQYIGDTDPDLRDELIYFTFSEWICEKEYYSDEDLRRMLNILLDKNHLFFRIGNNGDESVFTRSFSVLVVVLILIQHRKKPILDNDSFCRVASSLVDYYQQENDLRGYMDESGWAHAAAHGSDAFEELLQCTETDTVILQKILNAVKKVLYNWNYILCNEEDERIARMIYKMLSTNSKPSQLIFNWFDELSECSGWEKTRIQYIARVNTKNFIRSLYFKLVHNKVNMDLINTLIETERRLNKF